MCVKRRKRGRNRNRQNTKNANGSTVESVISTESSHSTTRNHCYSSLEHSPSKDSTLGSSEGSLSTDDQFEKHCNSTSFALPFTTMSGGPEIKKFTISSTNHSGALKNKLDQGDKIWPTLTSFIQDNVENVEKQRPIEKILISTNGIAAVKCMLSVRKMLMATFKQDRIIKFVCMTTEQEIQSCAEYLKLADHIVLAPAGDNKNNYANVDEIVSHAVAQGVDAVWAGWGHASENPDLPRKLAENKICFIGPPASAMFSLGDKIASTIIAQSVGIPTIEWSGSGLKLDDKEINSGREVTVSDDLFKKACVSDVKGGLQAIDKHQIEYPLMIKASEGGGGKGIRKCRNETEFKESFAAVQAEVPGSPIFLMKCVENARHIEVQLIADRYGCVIPVFTRDCSIQRRCQKIIEEAPASIAPAHILKAMQQDAVEIAKKVGYESAGTVEYMYLSSEERYFFLELNPRLQVEHPCTEMISGINIPAIQIQIAMGLPLNRIADIRHFYGLTGEALHKNTPLPDDLVRTDVETHCIAARVTSENPEDFFRPTTGTMEKLNFQSNDTCWGYFSISSSGSVHEFADSQFGHLFASGKTRDEARTNLIVALNQLEIRASFSSQSAYLIDLLQETDFVENKFDTQWLDKRIADKVAQKQTMPLHEMIPISASVIAHSKITVGFGSFKGAILRGQVLPPSDLTEKMLFDLVKDQNIYKITATRCGPRTYEIDLNGVTTKVDVRVQGNGSTLVTHRDKTYLCSLDETSEQYKVNIGYSMVVFEKDNDPTVLKSPYMGKLLCYKKQNLEHVNIDAVYATVESMKLVFNVEVKKIPGKLCHVAKEGDLLYPGSVIAKIVDSANDEKYRPKQFTDQFKEWQANKNIRAQPELKMFEICEESCINILNGSIPSGFNAKAAEALVSELFIYLESSTLPHGKLQNGLSQTLKRFPNKLSVEVEKASIGDKWEKFTSIKKILTKHLDSLIMQEWKQSKIICSTVYNICDLYENGLQRNTVEILNKLLSMYKNHEQPFEGNMYDDAVAELITKFGSENEAIVETIYSHTQLKGKNIFMAALINAISKKGMHLVTQVADNLRDIGNIFHCSDVSVLCRTTLLLNNRTKYRQFLNKIIWDLEKIPLQSRTGEDVLSVCSAISKLHAILKQTKAKNIHPKELLENSPWLYKVVHEFFFDKELAEYAVKIYAQKHFSVDSVEGQIINVAGNKVDFYNIELPETSPCYLLFCHEKAHQCLALIKFTAKENEFAAIVNNEELLSSIAKRYSSVTQKNGARSHLRVMTMVNVLRDDNNNHTVEGSKDAQLEELPNFTEGDNQLVIKAEDTAAQFKNLLATKLPQFTVDTNVIVCCQHKPVMQVDLAGSEHLELWRIPSKATLESNRMSNMNVYKADSQDGKFSRIFVREAVDIPLRGNVDNTGIELIRNEIIRKLDNACSSVHVLTKQYGPDRKTNKAGLTFVANHVFLYITFPKKDMRFTQESLRDLEDLFCTSIDSQREVLYKHNISEIELVMPTLRENGHQLVKRRIKFIDETGVTPEFGVYDDVQRKLQHVSLASKLYGEKLELYDLIKNIDRRRNTVKGTGTTYVYDYPAIFGRACMEEWKKFKESAENMNGDEKELILRQYNQLTAEQQDAFNNCDYKKFFEHKELVNINGSLKVIEDATELKTRAENGKNSCGMVAWILRLFTPARPTGFEIIVISNDVTFQSGSFATAEDDLFDLASKYSRKHKFPRVNVSCNAGARIGLADDISKLFKVKFKDPLHPSEGFEYLYLDGNVDQKIKDQIVYEELPDGTLRIEAVIGKATEDIGVENLQGSGLIAGETSAAYEEVPTYCYVTGRSVGIGAYTARLARRIVQSRNSHLILTGYQALNTVLGKKVYTSNNQLGGIQIMHKNGITHAVVNDDYEGISKILKWLGYLPIETEPFPFRSTFGLDASARDVNYEIDPSKPYDVRDLIDSKNSRISKGICDCNSFDEIMQEWAKTIIAGRARIGGLPIGVVSSEFRNVMSVTPADPATPNSQSIEVHQAGQVWYPDSAFKTAEAIRDFNREHLPLLFIASLRGFSGGQKDMYEQVLKFGAQIVDALSEYRKPIIIYLPPFGELRGGAWAVLDSKINPGFIHMVADKQSRGGILEPNAIVGLKFREANMRALKLRSDQILLGLQKQIKAEEAANGKACKRYYELNQEIEDRIKEIEKPYLKVAVEYADSHDRAERMLAKGAVQHVTNLTNSRRLFIDIFNAEMLKNHLHEKYITAAFGTKVTRNEAHKWVNDQLSYYHEGFTNKAPNQQALIVEQFVKSEEWTKLIDNQKESSLESLCKGISLEALERIVNARRGSL